MKVAVTSDWHGTLPAVPACDLLLISGDVLPNFDRARGTVAETDRQADWFRQRLLPHLAKQPCADWAMTPGNHDWVFENPGLDDPHVLIDRGVTLGGLSVWGLPWTPWFCSWAFNAPEGASEAFIAEKLAATPAGIDVLISHGPPAGPLGVMVDGLSVGSPALRAAIERLQPRVVVCGHIHEGFGEQTIGRTRVINAALLDENYQPAHPVIVIDL